MHGIYRQNLVPNVSEQQSKELECSPKNYKPAKSVLRHCETLDCLNSGCSTINPNKAYKIPTTGSHR